MNRLLATVLLVGVVVGCAPTRPVVVREVHVRPDHRTLRENRALRRAVRSLRRELVRARAAADSETAARRRESQAQSVTVSALAAEVRSLAQTIVALEGVLREGARETAQAAAPRRGGAFGKLRVGAVPAQSPTPPEPRAHMDRPDRRERETDLLDPFSKAPSPGGEAIRGTGP